MTLTQTQLSRSDMVDYATLGLAPEELESQGLTLHDAWEDGLGPTKWVGVLLPSGVELLLTSYPQTPSNGVLVRAPLAIDGPKTAYELAHELKIPRARITWVREEGLDWSPFGFAEGQGGFPPK